MSGDAYAGPSAAHRHRSAPVAASNAVRPPPDASADVHDHAVPSAAGDCAAPKSGYASVPEVAAPDELPAGHVEAGEDPGGAERVQSPLVQQRRGLGSAAVARRRGGRRVGDGLRVRPQAPAVGEIEGGEDLVRPDTRMDEDAAARHHRPGVPFSHLDRPSAGERSGRPSRRHRSGGHAAPRRAAPLRPVAGGRAGHGEQRQRRAGHANSHDTPPSGIPTSGVHAIAAYQVQAAGDDDRGAEPGDRIRQHAPQRQVEGDAPDQRGVFQRRDQRGLAEAEGFGDGVLADRPGDADAADRSRRAPRATAPTAARPMHRRRTPSRPAARR